MKISAVLTLAMLACSTLAAAANPEVELKTNMGTITLELYPDKAPKTVENFLQYVKDGFLQRHHLPPRDQRLHDPGRRLRPRVWRRRRPRAPIQNEANNGLKNDAARSRWRARPIRIRRPRSSSSTRKNNDFLNFTRRPRKAGATPCSARSIKGMDVVNKIAAPTPDDGPVSADVPRKPVVIEDARIVSADKPAPTSPPRNRGLPTWSSCTPTTATSRSSSTPPRRPITVENFLGYVKSRPLQRHDLPPRHRRLHDPGRRLRAGHEAEADQRADQERGRQRAEERQATPSPWRARPTRIRPPRSSSSTSPDNAFLNHTGAQCAGLGLCVFGKVVEGTDVVDKIKGVKTGNTRHATRTCRSTTS